MEPVSVIRGDNYTMEVPYQTVDIIEAPSSQNIVTKIGNQRVKI